MIPLINDEHELAFILSHELAHVLAGHAKEEHSREFLEYGYGAPYLPVGLCAVACVVVGFVVEAVPLVLGGTLLMLPYGAAYALRMERSRAREEEADLIGLFLTTEAGFDPEAAARSFATLARFEDEIKEHRRRINAELMKEGKRLAPEEPDWLQTHPMVSVISLPHSVQQSNAHADRYTTTKVCVTGGANEIVSATGSEYSAWAASRRL